jgi:hypothetical protein
LEEKSLTAPSVRDSPKWEAMLDQMRSALETSLQVAMSRPHEWFTIMSRSLDHGETELCDRAALMAAAADAVQVEMETAAERATEEIKSAEALHAIKSQQVAAEVKELEQRIVTARSELMDGNNGQRVGLRDDQDGTREGVALIEAAVEVAADLGEEKLLEQKRHMVRGESRAASSEWRVASGEWRVASGEWRVASGEWRVASGEW